MSEANSAAGQAAHLEEALRKGLRSLSLALADSQITQLLAYLDLLAKWGRVHNLTAILKPQDMLTHHLLDSLAVVGPLLRHTAGQPTRLLDVGSGAGLPGAVIAITCPQVQVCCVDAVGKKAAFVQQAAAQLRLPNLRGLHARVEAVAGPFDVVASRAFASLPDFVRLSAATLAQGGTWMAMKGQHPGDEVAQLPAGVEVFHVEPLLVPGLDAARCVVWLRKSPQLIQQPPQTPGVN